MRSQLSQQLSPALDTTAESMSAEMTVLVSRETDSLRSQIDLSKAAVSQVLSSGLAEVLQLLGPLGESVQGLRVREAQGIVCMGSRISLIRTP